MSKAIAKTGVVTAAGAMSGTSLDGVDVAVLHTDGRDIAGFGRSSFRAYSASERKQIAAGFGLWAGNAVEEAAAVIEAAHLEILRDFTDVDLIGFHGQTLAHAPRVHGTLQVGNGAMLAQELGVPVVWDFRTADVELGGEGAPLAPFFHHACARYIKADGPVAFLNLGGVGNLTWVDPSIPEPHLEGALLAFDTGPANAPVNDLMQERLGLAYDKDGAVARGGTVETGALELFLAEPYFARMPPKSLDRNDFDEIVALVRELSDSDAAATLTAMCAAGVAEAMQHCPCAPSKVLVTGGGRRNPVLMQMLEVSLDCPVVAIEEVGLDGDMLEAQAFAYLAVRVARGMPTSCAGTTGVRAAVGGGTVSVPDLTDRAAE
ncbi:anhydro-N-acetylmuramic acid kinase [Sulfitobacter guttiformis]|uniref:Anhydro-N-acetylmuramic acid kinase n=1 Tax=Sulfitobacter guttiformis TaxID=74349 RepID=A0A420DMY6_9RHOB|nr:anhydro-N-acetylmuramic acid kinase [Sulfitobacter guttiformis]KIN72838.1 Anhydro-N-acetylmuramic acid kinase [Sulfitobacter guttiformis KCTC 32187]RKE95529.1 anhydro-N-acetylmuramic acid kinase [Sulfitobacter guttiformis]